MKLHEEIQLCEDVSKNHSFFFGEAMTAFEEMFRLAFDLSPGSQEKFDAAKNRLEIARNRCNKELKRLPI